MKKRALFLFTLLIITILLSSCTASFPSKENVAIMTSEEAMALLKDKTEEEIHDNWGEPDSFLSGFRGDIYLVNSRYIVVYYDSYDNDSKVTDVIVSDKQN